MIHWEETAGMEALPLIARPAAPSTEPAALVEWVRHHPAELRTRLHRHGALLFRGFGFNSPAAFESLAICFTPELLSYTGGASPRKKVHGHVYNSTEASPRLVISQHHEGAYLPEMPAVISF